MRDAKSLAHAGEFQNKGPLEMAYAAGTMMRQLALATILATLMNSAAGWKAQKLAVLDDAEKPQALVRFAVTKALRELVNAVPEAQANIQYSH